MLSLFRLAAPFAFLTLGACSVWQNASRKYLDKSAYDLAGLKLRESLVGCAEPVDDPSWRETPRAEAPRVFTREQDEAFELRVLASDRACDYRFGTAQDRDALTDRALEASTDAP